MNTDMLYRAASLAVMLTNRFWHIQTDPRGTTFWKQYDRNELSQLVTNILDVEHCLIFMDELNNDLIPFQVKLRYGKRLGVYLISTSRYPISENSQHPKLWQVLPPT